MPTDQELLEQGVRGWLTDTPGCTEILARSYNGAVIFIFTFENEEYAQKFQAQAAKQDGIIVGHGREVGAGANTVYMDREAMPDAETPPANLQDALDGSTVPEDEVLVAVVRAAFSYIEDPEERDVLVRALNPRVVALL